MVQLNAHLLRVCKRLFTETGPGKVYKYNQDDILVILAFLSFGVINHLLQILQSFNLFVYAFIATIAWIGYLFATVYLLRIAWIRSGFSSKDSFMTKCCVITIYAG